MAPSGYNITERNPDFPNSYLDVKCRTLYVELLDLPAGRGTGAHHAVFNIIFEGQHLGNRSMRIHMTPNYESDEIATAPEGYIPGYLSVMPFTVAEPSAQSLLTYQLRTTPGWDLGNIIEVLYNARMESFYFAVIDDRYYGCRDWLAQCILLFEAKGFVIEKDSRTLWAIKRGPNVNVKNVYDVLGLRITEDRQIDARAIDRGRFRRHTRIESGLVPYKDSARALWIENNINRVRKLRDPSDRGCLDRDCWDCCTVM